MDLATNGAIGAKTARTLDDCVVEVAAVVEAARAVRPEILDLCHRGPIAMPEDARYILGRVEGLDGLCGASSMGILPTEEAIARQTQDFMNFRLRRAGTDED